MTNDQSQNWQTESYRGFDIHVTALPHADRRGLWDYSVRIAQPGEDTSAQSELTAESGDDADYVCAEAATAAGLVRGQAMVDALLQ